MKAYSFISLRTVPSARLLAAFIAGILLQWYTLLSLSTITVIGIAACLLVVGFLFLPAFKRYNWQWLQGTAMLLLIAVCGALLTYIHNIQHQPQWFQNNYTKGAILIATIDEPLVAKPNSYKAIAKVTAVQNNHKLQQATGNILVYFKKDNALTNRIGYGSQIVFAKAIQAIQNTGNPGGFDYRRYLQFQDITNQVYLQAADYVVLPQKNASTLQVFLQKTRAYVITALQKYIPGKREQGVAEALLIGYRNDLDKGLVQSYSHTGVVHIIAISGLHLGMIYGLLVFYILAPFKNRRWYRWAMPIIVLTILWLFTLVAGAVPSIARSAVMFSFIVLGESLRRKGNIYNTLAVSALCMLIYNPFYLWDVGFQLSYAAVVSIVVFFKVIYNGVYFENKLLNKVWTLTATNIAAQILTLPIILFYFHQFPLLFLITNLVVVPLSGGIIFIEIFIVMAAAWAWLATMVGKLAGSLLWLMNSFIIQIEKLPFALWENIKTDVFQTIALYLIILLITYWLLGKNAKALLYALSAMLLFAIYTNIDIYKTKQQHKLIVYNIPKATAIDILQGNNCRTLLSATTAGDTFMQNFYLQPTRLLYRANINQTNLLTANNYLVHTGNKSILVIGKTLPYVLPTHKITADAVIITGNPKVYMSQVNALIKTPLIVFDGSNPAWKTERWKKDCNSLHLRFHSVAQDGAFIMDLQ